MNCDDLIDILIEKSTEASRKGEVPVAAAIVNSKTNEIISLKVNNRQKSYDVLGHAEILCIREASNKIKDWRLDGYTMYVTLKPCDMCKSIIAESRLDKVFYLLDRDMLSTSKCDIELLTGINDKKEKYSRILSDFFSKMR